MTLCDWWLVVTMAITYVHLHVCLESWKPTSNLFITHACAGSESWKPGDEASVVTPTGSSASVVARSTVAGSINV